MLKDLFLKNIYRDINGVIQAGQKNDTLVAQELDEYVVTEELADHLRDLLKHYTNSFLTPTDKMGVWISGFFGSGKSHFLKILSYLLEQKSVDGNTAVDYFRGKRLPAELMGLIEKVGSHKADALLFNIESKTAVGSRNQRQNIVEVFLRVFNEFLGYSDTLWIAEIEHTLESEGKLEEFKEAVFRILGKDWRSVRDTLLLRQGAFIQALKDVGYDEVSASAYLRMTPQTFEITPGQFAKRIAQYCRNRGPDYRLVFLVDEIGQYIGDDRNLMLNLQTVVEDLGTHGAGQVWVMVTSQESIDTVTDVRDYDFSKIQGRFRTRINLSSTNTDDVIKWRILQKSDMAAESLHVLYDQQEQSLRNMLSFDGNTHALKAGFQSAEEFAQAYPFQPYQFELLQKVFEKVRKQGEAGKSLSQGERSLLNAFQEALQKLDATSSLGGLSTFAQFYDTIETFLDGPVKSTVRRAATRSDLTETDVLVLKALYLIKNIPEIPATLTNVTTLMIAGMDDVRRDVETTVRTSLEKLALYHLISQNADTTYTFLSDEEQEINREISAIRIDPVQLADKLGRVFFEDICPRKYKAVGGRDFEFNKRFESYTHGAPSHALTLQVCMDMSHEMAQRQSTINGTLMMVLPMEHIEYRSAMEHSMQIANYTRKDFSTLSDSQRRILQAKHEEIVRFETKARTLLKEACKEAIFYVYGQEEKYSGEADSQISRALEKLVANTYTQLSYIDDPLDLSNESSQIKDLALRGQEPSLSGRRNGLALDVLTRYLEECDRQHLAVTVEDIVSHYNAPPYGWMDRDVVGLIAVLLHHGQVKLTYLGEPLLADHPQFADKVLRAVERKKVVVNLLREVPADIQSKVRRVLLDHFEQAPATCDSYEALSKFIREQIDARMAQPLRNIIERQSRAPQSADMSFPYPGVSQAKKLQTQVGGLLAPADSEALVNSFLEAEGDLDDCLGQIRQLDNFYSKTPIQQFDKAVLFLAEHRTDWAFVADYPEIMSKKGQMESILRDERPYTRIPELPRLIAELQSSFDAVLNDKRNQYLPFIQAAKETVGQLGTQYPEHEVIQGLVVAEHSRIEEYEQQLSVETKISALTGYSTLAQERVVHLKKQISDINDREKPRPSERTERVASLAEVFQPAFLGNELRIETREQMDIYLETIKRELEQILQDHVLIIRR